MLASWTSTGYDFPDTSLEVIEFFAGISRVCKLAQWRGFESRGFELNYDTPPPGLSTHSQMPHRSAFDFCGEAGFLFLDGISYLLNSGLLPTVQHVYA